METILTLIQQFSSTDRVLLGLIVSILLLLGLTMLFLILALFYRYQNHRKALRWNRLEEQWSDVIFEILSGTVQPDELMGQVAKQDQLFLLDYLSRYAKWLRGYERNLLFEMAHPFLPLLEDRIRKGDPEQRARAVRTLAILTDNRTNAVYLHALRDPSPLVSMMAARILLKNPTPESTREILSRIDQMDWNVSYLSNMLVQGGAVIIPTLREELADTTLSTRKRTIVCEALRGLNDSGALPLAYAILEEKEEPELFSAVLRLIADLGYETHLPAVLRCCESPNEVIRINAYKALSQLCDPSHHAILSQGIDDNSPWVAFHAVRGLKAMDQNQELAGLVLAGHPRSELIEQVLKESEA
jgi:HEAT repeat protein